MDQHDKKADTPQILVVDDERWGRELLKELLILEGYPVDTAVSGEEAIEKINIGSYDLVISDLKMRKLTGIDVLREAKKQHYDPEVLLITAHGSVETAVEALKIGAFDYHEKPINTKRFLLTIRRALEKRQLKGEIRNLKKQVEEKYGRSNIIAVSDKMRKIMEIVDTISRTDAAVLIQGESGTGKELVARAIHAGSDRAHNPFIPVNCGALPEPLLESELFGHAKGAFTGAVKEKKGLFEEAEGGTLLLDEIGELPLPLQVKLLRVLQNGEVRPVGSNVSKTINVRIIACTNKQLQDMVEAGTFRDDLFYRLRVVPITIPALIERKEDIPPLINHFLRKYTLKMKKAIQGFSPEAMKILVEYHWPGNIREVENCVEGTLALTSSGEIQVSDLSFILSSRKPADSGELLETEGTTLEETMNTAERACILKALKRNSWNQVQTARELSIGRSSLWRKIEKYDLRQNS